MCLGMNTAETFNKTCLHVCEPNWAEYGKKLPSSGGNACSDRLDSKTVGKVTDFFCTWATTNLYNPYACKLNPPHPTHDQLACVHTPPPYLYIPVSYLWKTKSTPWTSIVSPLGSTSSTAWCATPNAMKKIRKHWAWRISQVTLSLLTV